MAAEIIVLNEFEGWYDALSEEEQLRVSSVVVKLQEAGAVLGFPYSSQIQTTQLSGLRELRVQSLGRPYRILYKFDPARQAVLILAGDKTGDDRWYERAIPRAVALWEEYRRKNF